MSMKKKLYFLLYLLCCSVGLLHAQTITISGNVEDDFLGTALDNVILSLHECDSTIIQDTLPCITYNDRSGRLVAYQYRTTFMPQENKTYIIHALKEGYGEKWLFFTVTNKDKDLNLPVIKMRREMERTLDEVVVKATKVKMFYKGDTLVYNANAFKLPDGSMLDALIAQLPGVKLNDNGEIFVNGRKVEELLLGSRSFMRGNKKVLMEYLPYYTVSDLKVYEKASDESVALGHDVGGKRYVMDVNLKQEYKVGYIANIEAAGGTENRWLGRGFLLGFTNRWRHTLHANANNVNESRHVGNVGYWSPDRMPQNLTTIRSVAGETDYSSTKGTVKNTLSADYSNVTTTIDMRERRETFLEGMSPMSQNKIDMNNKSYNVGIHNYFSLLKPFFLTLQTDFTHTQANGFTSSVFHQWGDTLTASMLTSALDKRTETTVLASASAATSIKKEKHRDIGFNFLYMYYNNEVKRANKFNVIQNSFQNVRYNADDILNHSIEIRAGGFYRQAFGKQWNIHIPIEYTLRTTQAHDFLFHPDTLTLPSQIEALNAITDPHNSYNYRYTKHRENLSVVLTNNVLTDLMPGVKMSKDRFRFTLNIPVLKQQLDYQRGNGSIIDTMTTHNTIYINPKMRFKQQFGKNGRNEIQISAEFTTHELDLLQSIAFRDDSQPLVVKLGNRNLKARQTSNVRLNYAKHNGPGKQELSMFVGLDYSHRDIAQSLIYNKTTGVYTYQPVNIGGSYKWNGTLNYSRNLDKKQYWTVQSNASAILFHSVDHSMFSGETESRLNKVNTYTLEENAYIQYNKEALNIRATGDVKWRRSKGRMLDFSTLCTVDYQYGLSARYTIPKIKTTLSADCNVYSRRGYGSTELNTNDFVMNASVSQSLLKGKLIARLESFDLFHQLSNTQYEVNAQGRVETWYRSLPHYIMLHLVYHWNKNPKK